MELQKLQTVLEETFSANFVSYYRSHAAHINIVGPNFPQYHKLLEKVYEYFQGNIDTIGEKIRTVRAKVPANITTILEISGIEDKMVEGSPEEYLATVLDAIDIMVDQYHAVNVAAEDVDYIDISNFAQDQIGILVKFRWMLEATLEMDDQ